MLFTRRAMEHRRALKSKAFRLGAFSTSITALLFLAFLTMSPTRFRPVLIQKDLGLSEYRVSEPKSYDDEPNPPNWNYRKQAVKKAFLHAYQAYEYHAFPADEWLPLSNKPRQKSAFTISTILLILIVDPASTDGVFLPSTLWIPCF